MARRIKEVNRSWLESCIKEAEKDGSVKGGIVAMHKTVADLYNAGDSIPEQLTHSVIGLRIAQWDLPFITVAGKRGRVGGNPNIGQIARNRGKRGDKLKGNPEMVKHFEQLRDKTPPRFLPILELASNGSKAAAMKLHCLECCAYMTAEVRKCSDNGSCALWAFRPYQGAVEVEEQTESE